MKVTTQLIGKLGGGGAPEMATAQVASTGFVRIPSGWGKAMGVFGGAATGANPTVFGAVFKGMSAGSTLNGGGSSTGQPISIQPPARLRGCAWNSPQGGGLDGHHHTTYRAARRRAELGELGRKHFLSIRSDRAKGHIKTRRYLAKSPNRRQCHNTAGGRDDLLPGACRRFRIWPGGSANGRIPKARLAHRVVVA